MKKGLLVLVLCTFVATPAMADSYGTVDVQWASMVRGMSLRMVSSASYGTVELVEDVGLQQLTLSNLALGGTGTVAIPNESYLNLGYTQAFCIDLWDNKPELAPEYNVQSLNTAPDFASVASGGMGLTKAKLIAEVLTYNTYDTPEDAAAVQVAIWEILDENHFIFGGSNPWNVLAGANGGNFYLDTTNDGSDSRENTVAHLANSILGNLDSGLSFDRYTALSNGPGTKDWQDFVVVPVPGAVLLGLFGLGAAGLKLRKRSA